MNSEAIKQQVGEQPRYCWPGCNPKPGEFACACTCRMLALIEGRPFRPLWTAKDQNAPSFIRLKCPHCKSDSIRNSWGEGDMTCFNCGREFLLSQCDLNPLA